MIVASSRGSVRRFASRTVLAHLSLACALLAAACSSTPDGFDTDTETSLYALVETIDGVAFHPPFGPALAESSGTFDATLLSGLSVVLENVDASGGVHAVATFDASSSPVLQLVASHDVYFVNVPAAAYFTDASRAYRFRVISDGRELGRSDLSDRVFAVLAKNPNLTVGVKVRVDQRPLPVATSLAPSTVLAGSESVTLTVLGHGFLHDSVVRFGSTDLATTFVSGDALHAVVPATSIARAGTSDVRVVTPAPGGGSSASMVFTAENARPTIASVTPSLITAGSGNITVTIDGTSFAEGALVTVGGTELQATRVSGAELTVVVGASLLAAPGTLSVIVTNPAPSAGPSSAATLTVRPETPVLTALTPSSVVAGSGASTLTIDGSRFAPGAIASVNHFDVPTTFVSSTRVTAALSAATVAIAGTVPVVVTNAGPSAGTSASLTLTINNPTPILSALTPSSVNVGSGAFTLTIDGTSFVSGASVTFGGTALATTFVSSTRVTASVSASLVSTLGSWNVTVTNPAPNAGASAARTFSTTCASGTHAEGGVCTSDTRSCTVVNGTGSQTWNGTSWGACTVTSCNAGYSLSGGTCVANPTIATASLIVHLDAANPASYPGTGTTWFDLSGRGNNFTLFNGVGWNAAGYMTLDGANDYIRSAGNLDFTQYDQILIELWVKPNVIAGAMAFEHTPNWNTNPGGLGLAIHNGGFGTVANQHHTNHNMGTVVRNYNATIGTSWSQQVNLFSRISDATGRLAYVNGARVPFVAVNGWSTSTSGSTSFTNAQFFVGSRAGTGSFLNGSVSVLRIYGIKLTDAQVQSNFDANRARYGL